MTQDQKKEKDRIVKWLKDRDLINGSKLERKCRIPQGALLKALNGNDYYLSVKHNDKIKSVLERYGYK